MDSIDALVKPFRFLDLPRGVRERVYRELLIYSPRRKKEDDDTPYSSCHCKGPQNLGLLRVNRKVYNEAARIFWSENRHRFDSVDIFISVIHDLSPWLRGEIKDARIHADPCAAPRKELGFTWHKGKLVLNDVVRDWTDRQHTFDMYQFLGQCTSLEVLQIHDSVINRWAIHDHDTLRELAASAPRLKSLTITMFDWDDYFVAACLSRVRERWGLALRGHPIDLVGRWNENTCYVDQCCAMPCRHLDDSDLVIARKRDFYRKRSYILPVWKWKRFTREIVVTEFQTSISNSTKSTWVARRRRGYRTFQDEDGYTSD
ncbi:hypothetical protein F5Y10DRAFT_260896 [Nemania abortiva]|nr:hypothetical protein F5Y10DRAFT_260896 [Nemania abortiva]